MKMRKQLAKIRKMKYNQHVMKKCLESNTQLKADKGDDAGMKTDARVRYTKMVIRKTFIELLDKKPINKITVTEICDKAEINRATFYKHYLDIYDLLEKMEEELEREYIGRLSRLEENGMEEMLRDILTVFKENLSEYSALFSSNADPQFRGRMIHKIYEMYGDRIKMPPALEQTDYNKYVRGILYRYISSGSEGMISQWVESGMRATPEQEAKAIVIMINSTMIGFKEQFSHFSLNVEKK